MLLQFKNKTHLHELIEMLFHVMDVNGNGVLEFKDLEYGFQTLNIPGRDFARHPYRRGNTRSHTVVL